MQSSPCGGDPASGFWLSEGIAAASPEVIAAAPPEGWDLNSGMAAALEGASDSCPELALAELATEAFLLHRYTCPFMHSFMHSFIPSLSQAFIQ